MRTDERDEALAAELRAAGRRIDVPPADEHLVSAVMVRVADEPAPREAARLRRHLGWLAERRRAAGAAFAALLVALALTPPVRATVAEWFGFGGVVVREAPAQPSAPPPPTAGNDLTLRQARDLVAFTPVLPAELGRPGGVEVSADRRVLSLTWTETPAGTIRLDQFDGELSPVMTKLAPGAVHTEVAGHPALWFSEPHEVVVMNQDGSERTESARLAGHTLIWQRNGVTLRLEGDLTRVRAVAIARSAR